MQARISERFPELIKKQQSSLNNFQEILYSQNTVSYNSLYDFKNVLIFLFITVSKASKDWLQLNVLCTSAHLIPTSSRLCFSICTKHWVSLAHQPFTMTVTFFSPYIIFVFLFSPHFSLWFLPQILEAQTSELSATVQCCKDRQQPFPHSPFGIQSELTSAFSARSALVAHAEAII